MTSIPAIRRPLLALATAALTAAAVLGIAAPAAAAGTTISGTVTCAGAPLASSGAVFLYQWDGTTKTFAGVQNTNASGVYTFTGVAEGSYLIRLQDQRSYTDDRCASEWYGAGHVYKIASASTIAVPGSGSMTVSDALSTGAHADAHVVYGPGQLPASGVQLYGWADSDSIDSVGSTDASGNAHLTGLIPGGVRLSSVYTGYPAEYYSDWGGGLTVGADYVTAAEGAAAAPVYIWHTSAGGSLDYFSDVPSTSSVYTAVEWMYQSGTSTGTSQPYLRPLYKPLDAVSRQAMAQFLYRLEGGGAAVSSSPHFADVPSGSPFFTAAQWMYEQGISTGTAQPSGLPLYKPTESVSRQAMAQFLFRVADPVTVTNPSPYFADVPNGSSFYAAIQWMYEQGISTGTSQPSGLPLYKPLDPVSRQAMAQFLYRFSADG